MPAPRAERITSVDALRGIAALVVVFFHFLAAKESPMAATFGQTPLRQYGWLGVQAFFVISGFVVPLAMFRARYKLSDFWRFMAKRVVRLDPPYLVSILAVIVLSALMPGTLFQPVPIAITPAVIFGHLFYGFSHLLWQFTWLNSVYWTLAIEFQYYVAVALLVPLLISPARWRGVLAIGGLVVLSFVGPRSIELFEWGAVFCLGLVLFMQVSGLWNWRESLVGFAIVGLASVFTAGYAATLVGIATTVAIATWTKPGRFFEYLGKISFSLYLVHIPFGGRLLFHADRLGLDGGQYIGALVLALAVSFLAAHLLWQFVERPAQRLATRIAYATREPQLPVGHEQAA